MSGIGPPCSMRERSRISLTIWTRCPVSTSILTMRSRIRAGTAVSSASFASVSASRLIVESGVRSSWLRFSVNSERIALESPQLRDILHDDPRAAVARGARADHVRRSIGRAQRHLGAREPALGRDPCHLVDAPVHERLDRGLSDERPRCTFEVLVRETVRERDPRVVIEADERHAREVGDHRELASEPVHARLQAVQSSRHAGEARRQPRCAARAPAGGPSAIGPVVAPRRRAAPGRATQGRR